MHQCMYYKNKMLSVSVINAVHCLCKGHFVTADKRCHVLQNSLASDLRCLYVSVNVVIHHW